MATSVQLTASNTVSPVAASVFRKRFSAAFGLDALVAFITARTALTWPTPHELFSARGTGRARRITAPLT